MQIDYELSPMDFDTYDADDEPVCVCPDYAGATQVVFCKACNVWTDETEEALLEPEWANAPVIERLPVVSTPIYQFTAEELTAA